MPANRSRTLEWRRCLRQICDRGGAIEIAVARHADPGSDARFPRPGRDLMWRVRVLDVTDKEIIVEQPTTLGRVIQLSPGVSLVAVLSIGQNRWLFTTRNLGDVDVPIGDLRQARRVLPGLRLVMPESVERCQRRNYYRMETASLTLPAVDAWPLLDPQSVVLAERAAAMRAEAGEDEAAAEAEELGEDIMPEVGPKFTATLLNIGGGGMGLLIEPEDADVLAHHRLFWLRFLLPPALRNPVCATGKVVHTHMESSQQVYAGTAFDFSFNPAHQRFVIDQICRYIALQQREQLLHGA